jgi:hypothetical protein
MTNASPAPRELSRRGQWCLVLGSSLIVLFAAAFVAGFVGLVFRIEPGWWVLVPAIGIQAWFSTAAWRRVGTARPVRTVMITLVVGWFIIGGNGRAVAARHRHLR